MLTIEWIVQQTQSHLLNPSDSLPISTFSIDTRTLQPGNFFIALSGSQTDGHLFLDEAFQKGASGALIHNLDIKKIPKHWRNLVCVNNTLKALHDLASAYRAEFQIPIIAVTGSSGKTTTKELIAHLLSKQFRTYKSPGNFNSEYGLPLALLEMPKETEAAVFELGLQRPGDIRLLAELLQPNIGVITRIGEAHLEFFHTPDKIADEKWKLIESLPKPDGLAILNADSPYLHNKVFSGRKIWFGAENSQAQIRLIHQDSTHIEGLAVTLQTPKGKFEAMTHLLGNYNGLNIAAAWAMAAQLGLSTKTIQEALRHFSGVPHRMELKKSKLGWILDDSYNANPSAVKEAIQTLQKLELPKYKKIFVFGEMRELGEFSIQAHCEIAEAISKSDIAQIFLVGSHAEEIVRYLISQAQWPATRVIQATDKSDLFQKVTTTLSGNRNLILVKGSRANLLEKLVDALV